MSETDFQVPDAVADALDAGMPAVKAFRQFSGLSQHDAAVAAHIGDERLAAIESGRKTATAAETDELSEVLHVPPDLLVDE